MTMLKGNANVKERYEQALDLWNLGDNRGALKQLAGIDHPKVNELRERIQADMPTPRAYAPPQWARWLAAVGIAALLTLVIARNNTGEALLQRAIEIVLFGVLFWVAYTLVRGD